MSLVAANARAATVARCPAMRAYQGGCRGRGCALCAERGGGWAWKVVLTDRGTCWLRIDGMWAYWQPDDDPKALYQYGIVLFESFRPMDKDAAAYKVVRYIKKYFKKNKEQD
jgi:hypothetical protein